MSIKDGIIYTPKGRAGEYAHLAVNLFRGCDHGCAYCYAPNVLRMTREEFNHPRHRDGLLDKLEREAAARQRARLAPTDIFEQAPRQGENSDILLCFTCDPYPAFDVETAITRQAIEILHRYGFTVTALTKGGRRALRDLDLFTPADTFATTLTCWDQRDSNNWEPGADSVVHRIEAIDEFHSAGIPTWVSLEPVLFPEDAINFVRKYRGLVDFWKVGAMNYHPHVRTINWPQFARDIVDMLESVGAKYLLKEDLLKHLPDGIETPGMGGGR